MITLTRALILWALFITLMLTGAIVSARAFVPGFVEAMEAIERICADNPAECAKARTDRQCPPGDISCRCFAWYGQDGESLETTEQQAGYDRCMQRMKARMKAKPEQACGMFAGGELENKTEFKRCVTRLRSGDKPLRAWLACAGEAGHKGLEQGECEPMPPSKAAKAEVCADYEKAKRALA
jgi:hypothetical protein